MTDLYFDEDTEDEVQVDEPSKYKVVFFNDDYTPMEFVVYVLVTIFHKTQAEAVNIMFNVHNTGQGVAGVYGHEIAEMKTRETMDLARANGHPLRCEVQPE